jgi:ribosomal protein S18 acetylase RimI-like enzyme
MNATFEAAGVSDLDALLALMGEYYAFDRLPFDRDQATRALTALLSDRSLGSVWLILVEAEAAGYLVLTFGYSLEFHGRDAFVDELYIREAFRRSGLGTQAIAFAVEQCRAAGVRALHLEVERANTRAQAFYRTVGFVDHNRYLLTRWLP